MIEYIINNKEWIFSGIGGVIFTLLIGFLFRKKSDISIKQKQKAGDSSVNSQIGQINKEKNGQ